MAQNIKALQRRILLITLMPGIMIFLVMGVIHLLIRYSELDQQYIDTTLEHNAHQASMIALVEQPRNRKLSEFLQVIISDNDVKSAAIISSGGRLLVSAGAHKTPANLSELLTKNQYFSYDDKNMLVVTPMPFVDAEFYPAWLMVEKTLAESRLVMFQSLALSIALILIALSLAFAISTRLSQAVTLPLENLVISLRRIREGFFDTRIPIHSHSLMIDIERSVNDVINSLETQHRQMTRNIQQYNDELQETLETIEIQNVELDIARKKALEVSRSKSEFLANMSHEIRTPLNGILGFSNLMLSSGLTSQQQDYMLTIEKSSQGMLTMLNDILDYSRLEAGKLELLPVSMNLRMLIDDSMVFFAPAAHAKSLELVCFIYNDVPENIIADKQRLQQVLTNLVSNAIKFTHSGHIAVRVMLENEYDDNQILLKIAVTDTGTGLAGDQQNTLFEAFTRADNSRNTGGTGLGLAISKHLVEQMNGEIGLDSQSNQGSTFWFSFKAARSNQPDIETANLLEGQSVLLVEPGELSRLSCSHLLGKLGAEVTAMEELPHASPPLNSLSDFDLALISMNSPLQENRLSEIRSIACQLPVILTVPSDAGNLNDMQLPDNISLMLKPVSESRLEAYLSTNNRPQKALLSTNRRLNIMVVDDNAINLKLLKTILDNLSVVVTTVSNGYDALELCRYKLFDLIFMDVQMPGMDGIQTVQKIRQLSSGSYQSAIIAVTAHALEAEKQQLLTNGMNDYMTKPVSEKLLIQKINQWTDTDAGASTETPANFQTDTVQENSPFNLKRTVHIASGNRKLPQEILTLFRDELPEHQQLLQRFWKNKDHSSLLEQVHKLHGASLYCGVPALEGAAAAMEELLKTNHSIHSDEVIIAFEHLIEAIKELEKYEFETM